MEYVSVADVDVPALGLGTYKLRGQTCVDVVEAALEMGYRHIDTAEYYNNQREVGEAIRNSPVDRDEIFLTTKIWRSNLAYDDARRSARESLERLGLEYVDLLLIHWPSTTVPVEETLAAMAEFQQAGKARYLGVSNFSVSQLAEAKTISDVPILTNQVQYNPHTDQSELLAYCLDEEIMLTAYSPLAKGSVVGDETLSEIGDRYGKSPAQVALRWLVQQEMVAAIPKAGDRTHLEANLDIFDFELTDEEMNTIFDNQGGLVDRLRSALGL